MRAALASLGCGRDVIGAPASGPKSVSRTQGARRAVGRASNRCHRRRDDHGPVRGTGGDRVLAKTLSGGTPDGADRGDATRKVGYQCDVTRPVLRAACWPPCRRERSGQGKHVWCRCGSQAAVLVTPTAVMMTSAWLPVVTAHPQGVWLYPTQTSALAVCAATIRVRVAPAALVTRLDRRPGLHTSPRRARSGRRTVVSASPIDR